MTALRSTRYSPARTRTVASRNNRQTATVGLLLHAVDMTHVVVAIFTARIRLLLLLLLPAPVAGQGSAASVEDTPACRGASPVHARPLPGAVPSCSAVMKRSIGRSVGGRWADWFTGDSDLQRSDRSTTSHRMQSRHYISGSHVVGQVVEPPLDLLPYLQVLERQCRFYSASALLAMQSAVLARGILSVRLSVTFQYCVQTNEDTIVRFQLLVGQSL